MSTYGNVLMALFSSEAGRVLKVRWNPGMEGVSDLIEELRDRTYENEILRELSGNLQKDSSAAGTAVLKGILDSFTMAAECPRVVVERKTFRDRVNKMTTEKPHATGQD